MRAFLALLLLTVPAWGHDAPSGFAYPAYCCNGDGMSGDCQEISDSTVHAVTGGYGVRLLPGQHRLVTSPQNYMIPQSTVRPSPDGKYHLCLYPDQETMRCFFAPPGAV